MKRLPPFTISQPASVSEASETIANHGGAATLYAGGTELLLAMKEGVLAYEHLVDVKTIPGLDEIRLEVGELWIGAAVTHAQIEHSPVIRERLPALADVERRVANPRVRATGTLAGNLSTGNVTQSLFTVSGGNASGGGSTALTATLAAGAMASAASNRMTYVNNLWLIQQQSGTYRYYQECVYLLGLLNVAGKFKSSF